MSQAVIDTASATVYISGQVDWDMNYQVSSHTVEGQLSKALTNLITVLNASGSVENVLSLRFYIRGELVEFLEDIALILTGSVAKIGTELMIGEPIFLWLESDGISRSV